MEELLVVRDLTKHFGGLVVVDGLNIVINKGQIVGLIGPNGSGKTTTYHMMTGFYKPTRGKVIFKGEDITGIGPYRTCAKGLVRTFQMKGQFSTFSVLENVLMGCYLKSGLRSLESPVPTAGTRNKQQSNMEKAMRILELVGLDSQKDKLAGNLSHGYQKSLCIATVLGADPELLILDEPVAALSPERVVFMKDLICRIRDSGVTILMTEHNMKAIFDICDKIVVINAGRKIAEGTAKEIQTNPEVTRAYLGGHTCA